MRKLLILILIILVMVNIPAVGARTNSSWKQITEFKIHITNVVGFLNESYGLAVGNGGLCYYTNDGGKTWTRAQNKSFCRFGLNIVDEKVAWNCGNAGNVRLTTDGGRTWVPVTDFGFATNYISFIDDRTGWVASDEALLVTKDAGNSWIKPIIPTRSIGTISLLSVNEGYLLDKTEPRLYITKDACQTWATQSLDLAEALILPAMRWLDSQHGLIIGYSAVEKEKSFWKLLMPESLGKKN